MAFNKLSTFDIHTKGTISDGALNPTEVLQTEARWLYAQNNKYENDELHFTNVVDHIKEGIREGHLWRSKVSTTDHSNPTYAIMIYTKDHTDVADVIAVLNYLETSGIKAPNTIIRYKTDAQTRAGIYSGGGQKASVYSSATIRSLHGTC